MATLKANPQIPSPTPIITLPQLRTTLTSLQTTTHILAGLTHRNKNQHRGTKWWAPFNMLRRSLNKLTPDLEAAIQRADLLSSHTTTSKRKSKAAGGKQPELDRVVERAVWIKEALGGRAYEAFTQLTADRQFAQLGLVLIGVLAQVEAAIAPFVPEEPESEPEPQQQEKFVSAQADLGAGINAAAVTAAPTSADWDLGVAVSRDELLGNDDAEVDVHPPVERQASPAARRPGGKHRRDKQQKRRVNEEDEAAANLTCETSPPTKKRKVPRPVKDSPPTAEPVLPIQSKKADSKHIPAEISMPRTEKKPKPRTEETEGAANKPKKKKKKKAGDEFDDLFSSLL